MADEPAKTPIQNKYAQQYADDLAANRKEQGDVTAQIAGLQERLGQLKAEEHWLAQAQGSLSEAPVPSAPEAGPVTAEAEVPPADTPGQADTSAPVQTVADAPQAVPHRQQDQSVKEEPSRQPVKKTAPAKKTTATRTSSEKAAKKTTAKSAAKEAAPKKTTAKTVAKKGAAKRTTAKEVPAQRAAATEAPAGKAAAEEKSGPPLWQLIRGILLESPGQPCVAREVHDQLTQLHPDRATSIQTVRNSLETLVKKGFAEKSNQQGSVMYTAYADAEADVAPAADGSADGETGQAPKTAGEKVPAEV